MDSETELHGRPQTTPSVIDELIADVGVLPILASSYPTSLDGPTLSTVVLGAAGGRALGSFDLASTHSSQPFLPRRSTALKLAEYYMSHIYPRLPFFSIHGFWAQFNQVFSSLPMESEHNGTPDSGGNCSRTPAIDRGYSCFTVLLTLAISASSLSRSTDSVISSQSQRLFHAALRFRESAILPKRVTSVQSLLFLIQYATLNPTILDAWYLVGVAMRNCINLGLHQDHQSLGSVSASLLETRRRLWWSVYSFDRSISIAFGRPLEIPDEVIDVELPSFRIEPRANDVQIEGYLQRYRNLQLQSRIYAALDCRPSTVSQPPQTVIEAFAKQLSKWRDRNLPEHCGTLIESEWYLGNVLLYRPCRLLPERDLHEIKTLWDATICFVRVYRKLVECNGIFYIQVASEKACWVGLGILYSFWKLSTCLPDTTEANSLAVRTVDLWVAIKDVMFIIRTLSERWEDGRVLAEEFESISFRTIELLETTAPSHDLTVVLPWQVVEFGKFSSLTSIWTSEESSSDESSSDRDPRDKYRKEELQTLIAEI